MSSLSNTVNEDEASPVAPATGSTYMDSLSTPVTSGMDVAMPMDPVPSDEVL